MWKEEHAVYDGYAHNRNLVFSANVNQITRIDSSSAQPVWSVPRSVVRQGHKFLSFRASLDDILFHQAFFFPHETLPKAWTTLVNLFRKSGGLKEERIFEVSGELPEILSLCESLDAGKFEFEYSGDIHVIASALKRWLSELVHPVIPHDLYASFLAIVKDNEAISDKCIASMLHEKLAEMPASSCSLFLEILALLEEVLSFKDTNKMSESSLAVLFAPILFHSQKNMTMSLENRLLEARWLEILLGFPPTGPIAGRLQFSERSVVVSQKPVEHAITLGIVEQMLIVATKDTVAGLRAENGEVAFRLKLSAQLRRGHKFLLETHGTIVFLAGSTHIYAVDVSSVRIKWSFNFIPHNIGQVVSIALVSQANEKTSVFVLASGSVIFLDPMSGTATKVVQPTRGARGVGSRIQNLWHGLKASEAEDREKPLVCPLGGHGWETGSTTVPNIEIASDCELLHAEDCVLCYQKNLSAMDFVHFLGFGANDERFVASVEVASETNRVRPLVVVLATSKGVRQVAVDFDEANSAAQTEMQRLPFAAGGLFKRRESFSDTSSVMSWASGSTVGRRLSLLNVTIDTNIPISAHTPDTSFGHFLNSLSPECTLLQIEDYKAHVMLTNKLVEFEKMKLDLNRRVGILYWKSDQTENEAFGNSSSPAFEDFLDFFGQRVRLKGWDRFRAGLNVENDQTGEFSVYTEYQEFCFMAHVSVLLPFNANDEQKLERKSHIGNDLVVLIFWEGPGSFDASQLVTQMCHVFIVFEKVPSEGHLSRYRVAVICKSGVKPFLPYLPSPAIFDGDKKLHDWLMKKIINGERAVFRSDYFRKKLEKTRRSQLQHLCEEIGSGIEDPMIKMAPFEICDLVTKGPITLLKAITSYVGRSSRELSFQKGDIIILYCKHSTEWWNGGIGNQRGDFPCSNVVVHEAKKRLKARRSSDASPIELTMKRNVAQKPLNTLKERKRVPRGRSESMPRFSGVK
jgi:hypothetical protein